MPIAAPQDTDRDAGAARDPMAPGRVPPPLDLPRAGGGRLRARDQPGRAWVLYFYPRADTSGCTRQALDFQAALGDLAAAGVATVAGVSPDALAAIERFGARHGLTFPLAADPDHAAAEACGTWVEKSMYGRRYRGMERATFLIGADGAVAAAWRGVKVPGHAAQVLAAARALGAGS